MKLISTLIFITCIILLSSCATRVNINEAQEKVKIVKELPADKICTSKGDIEVKDILESSAIEELKNLSNSLGGNYVIIKNTKYKTTFVIHKAQAFQCN